ncbi:MAG: hypothetical protein N3F09_07000 [Bacteroidia bacterium]|nr:hypothetical protein [Bacteroidia bacterium]
MFLERVIFLFSLLIAFFIRAQYEPKNAPLFLNNETRLSEEIYLLEYPRQKQFSSLKPTLSRNFNPENDSLLPFNHYPLFKNFFISKSFNDWDKAHNKFHFLIHPVVTTEAGYDFLERRLLHQLSGGVRLRLNVNDDFSLSTEAEGGQISFPFFSDSALKESRYVMPGLGILYPKTKGTGYHFFQYSFRAAYSVQNNPYFTIQAGRDRFFVGDGERSLLHGPQTNPYWFGLMQFNVWKIQYAIWYAFMQDFPVSAPVLQKDIRRKYGVFHHIQWNVWKGLSIGILENVIWKGSDSTHHRGFDPNYLSPFVFFRPQEYALGSSDNSFLGFHFAWRQKKLFKIYGQLALDEFFLKEIRARKGWWANKQAWQLGFLYKVPQIQTLVFGAEYNEVRPYTYTHAHTGQNYAHGGLPLAHHLGANFRECLLTMNFRKGEWWCGLRTIWSWTGKDTLTAGGLKSNLGSDIFVSYMNRPYDYGHKTTQGDKHQIFHLHLFVRYYLLAKMNLYAEAGFIQRNIRSSRGYELMNPFMYIRISSSLTDIFREM